MSYYTMLSLSFGLLPGYFAPDYETYTDYREAICNAW